MYSQTDRDPSEHVEDIERVVESLMSESPAISTAFDRVNSVSSQMSELALDASVVPQWDGTLYHKPRNPPPLNISQPTTKDLDLYSPSSSPGLLSCSEIAPPEPEAAKSSVGMPSPIFHQSPPRIPMRNPKRDSMQKLAGRRLITTRSMPIYAVTPEIEPAVRRSASECDSIQLPPAAWDLKDAQTYSHLPSSNSSEPQKLYRSTSTRSQQGTFEKSLFKNSAIYCDLYVTDPQNISGRHLHV